MLLPTHIDPSELPRALQRLMAASQPDAHRRPAPPQLPEAGRRRRLGDRRVSPHGHGAGRRCGQAGRRTQAHAAAARLRADCAQRRSHRDPQPARIRPGRANGPADDPGRRARCRLEPGAQQERHQRCRLPRPRVRHAPDRRLQLHQEQLHAIPRARRARTGHAAVGRRRKVERRRGHAAHAGRHGAGPGRTQAGLWRTGRSRHGAAGAREGHAERPEGFQDHRPAHHAAGCACQEQRPARLRHRRQAARASSPPWWPIRRCSVRA